ncbi:MAG: hypothetical protein HY858_00190 [Candidatus Solibacter usitatus]|nr:hypothetical protein [Candidatus Solibacter usitatus]
MGETALYLMAGAVTVSSAALLGIAMASLGTYRRVKQLQEDVSPLIPRAGETLEQAQRTLTSIASDVRDTTDRARAVLELAQEQLTQIDSARVELGTHLKVQAERVELVLDDILSRVQEVVGVVHGTVLKPVREVSGMVAGVKAAVQTFMMGRRPTVDRATHDEEMFI